MDIRYDKGHTATQRFRWGVFLTGRFLSLQMKPQLSLLQMKSSSMPVSNAR